MTMTVGQFEKLIIDNLPTTGYERGVGLVLYETVIKVFPQIEDKLDKSLVYPNYSTTKFKTFMRDAFYLAFGIDEEISGDL
jgi:hypothetical protein